jgi:glycosyltransferase involved in cell wall biosynthesis
MDKNAENLEDILEIILITYNRGAQLERTLGQLFTPGSPAHKYGLTILDNNSVDNTAAIASEWAGKYPQIKYIRNKYNVGLGGNLVKAMEMADKKYLWIICDDDNFDWRPWPEIETAMAQDYDIVMTSFTDGFRNESIPYLLNEMAFVPSAIYNTKHITDLVMTNAYAMAFNLFPFHAMSCKVINEKGRIFVPKQKIVYQTYEEKSHTVKKPVKGRYHRLNTFNLIWGYIDAYQLIEDKKLRVECCDVLCLGHSFFLSMYFFFKSGPPSGRNFWDIFCGVNMRQKILLLLAALTAIISLDIYKGGNGAYADFFGVLKFKIWPGAEKNK